ncbi:conserved phage C-terminal domain-containing protein [Herbaspirillum frisingense]|uniref:Phage protein (TIGR02220 family) n=1 Tax=Herbaspirillum frisingense TaxID=92645 RepID=A0ABU1PHX9_9BURK|nr:conserved phage C-terminal domain-containing protein [Herbaspirillum frisingense]MDR6585548.1 putative phage protein (TIGR02220 family) [Herbaspirillum frisingense]
MTRPSFQFYPADWRNNAKLRRCSWGARGVWADVMCLLHDSDEYGILRWPLKEIAQAIGCPIALLKELVDKSVLKGTDKGEYAALEYTPRSGRQAGPTVTLIPITQGPIWFSSRMVRDEYIRQKKANRELYKDSPNYSPMPPIGDEEDYSPMPPMGELSGAAPMPPKSDLPSSSSSSSIKTKERKALSGKPDAEAVLAHLNSKTGRSYEPVKANLSLIASRLQEASVETCKAVIDARVAKWGNDDKMRDYLRPKTLFNATNFANYVGELGHASSASDAQQGPDVGRRDRRFAGAK